MNTTAIAILTIDRTGLGMCNRARRMCLVIEIIIGDQIMARIRLLSVKPGRIHEPGNRYWLSFEANYGYMLGNDRKHKLEYSGVDILGCLFTNEDEFTKLKLMMQQDFGFGPFSSNAVGRAARILPKDYDTDDYSEGEAADLDADIPYSMRDWG